MAIAKNISDIIRIFDVGLFYIGETDSQNFKQEVEVSRKRYIRIPRDQFLSYLKEESLVKGMQLHKFDELTMGN